jgi:hypothetical protein
MTFLDRFKKLCSTRIVVRLERLRVKKPLIYSESKGGALESPLVRSECIKVQERRRLLSRISYKD